MAGRPDSPVAAHRARRERRGFVRVEVSVRREDAALVRHVAAALSDPAREAEARLALRQRFAGLRTADPKTLLASAPLDGIDLERDRGSGRTVDL